MSIESTILGVKSSARLIARAPGITAVVVLALALVIGARPTILAVANSVLLSPLSSGAGQTSGQVFEGQMEWVGDDSSSSVSVNAQPEDENSSEGSSAA
ncbi:MAG TPA: hypothetical protein VLZ81_08790, partial [Blastocatellia bacterium]|nr:hypothetical protein [Blastocatellia bacterium]